ncbi:rRNA pseudouridine synthase [Luteimonas sp. BDR2-5]|uniref:pseudouridine synthase n=1 Tax=Proluteimonas luteida TaxID=2878685 RepID=UPI001E4DAD30|nr:pseudouridine synthase [Luteimonas sp. BDR2-5]MCD9029438.1 rRNA pseudouridine synthase [Luteimonas sp. BDR2-5]
MRRRPRPRFRTRRRPSDRHAIPAVPDVDGPHARAVSMSGGAYVSPVHRQPRYGIARVLSKRGLCSRSEAERWVREGRVRIAGTRIDDPEHPVALDEPRIRIEGQVATGAAHRYLMLNKPRGLVTSVRDEQGRDTVYRCLDAADVGWVAPVGRLDKASEGLLLFTSDPAWAARIADPAQGPTKTYHVQVDTVPGDTLLAALHGGVDDAGDWLQVASARVLRSGGRNAWLEIVLDEGRNRQIRRLLGAFDVGVLRLVRVAIGRLALGELPKGAWRELSAAEVARLAPPSTTTGPASGS